MTDSRRRALKRVAARVGVTSSTPFWQPLASRYYRRKLATNADYREWVSRAIKLEEHWGHETVADPFVLQHLGSQLYEICRTLRGRLGSLDGKAVLDAGASDGLFLQQVGARRGVGVNFLVPCAKKIVSDGYPATVADVERLPFADGSFDVVICCETLEHVPNPVSAINELARVCRGRVVVTIPWIERTRITARPAGWPDVESHIFEFSETDFQRVLTHANVRMEHRSLIEVFPEPANPLVKRWLQYWMYPSYFPRLQYYELTPVNR